MADVASKQQTTALFLSTIVTRTRRQTELTKIWQTWWENCALPENIQFSFSCRFFNTVKLHSLTWSVWGPLDGGKWSVSSPGRFIAWNKPMIPTWAPELVWLWVKRRQISCIVSRNTAVRHSARNFPLHCTPLAHKVFMLLQFMLCFWFITPRHQTRNQVKRLLKRVTKVSRKNSHMWAEISMQRARSGTDREQLNNWEVFVWRIGTWDCPLATYYLAVLFNVPVFLLCTVDTCFTTVSLPSAFDTLLFFSVALQPNLGLDCLIVEVSRSHNDTHTHTQGKTPLHERSACRTARYLDNTQQTKQTNIRCLQLYLNPRSQR